MTETTTQAPAPATGCVCPPTAELTCRGASCPRKPTARAVVPAGIELERGMIFPDQKDDVQFLRKGDMLTSAMFHTTENSRGGHIYHHDPIYFVSTKTSHNEPWFTVVYWDRSWQRWTIGTWTYRNFRYLGRPDNDGWVRFDGDYKIPMLDTFRVNVRRRDGQGDEAATHLIKDLVWEHSGGGHDVVAFRMFNRPDPAEY